MKSALIFAVVLFLAASAEAQTQTNGEFDNNCSQALVRGRLIPTDCITNWVDPESHKTYCFGNDKLKEAFSKDTKGNAAKAEENFKKISEKQKAKAN